MEAHPMNASIVLGATMLATAAAVMVLQPEPITASPEPILAQTIPAAFGEWKEVSFVGEQVDPAKNAEDPSMDRPYDDVLMRAYGNSRGDIVLLTLAYGRNQRQEVKIHRPDVCYTAQGRTEAVSYWIRIGDVFTDNAWSIRYHIFSQGVSGRAVDGMLVRASQIVSDSKSVSPERYRVQERFLADLVRALPKQARRQLVG
jgi:hypothetical protein